MFQLLHRRFLCNDSKIVMSSIQLYKYLLRQCEKLPPDACKHYKFAVRQSYKQHKFEPDPERVKEIIAKSVDDAEWIVNKVQSKPLLVLPIPAARYEGRNDILEEERINLIITYTRK